MPSLAKLPLTLSSTCFAVIRVSSPLCLRYLLPYPATCSQGGSSGLFACNHSHAQYMQVASMMMLRLVSYCNVSNAHQNQIRYTCLPCVRRDIRASLEDACYFQGAWLYTPL